MIVVADLGDNEMRNKRQWIRTNTFSPKGEVRLGGAAEQEVGIGDSGGAKPEQHRGRWLLRLTQASLD